MPKLVSKPDGVLPQMQSPCEGAAIDGLHRCKHLHLLGLVSPELGVFSDGRVTSAFRISMVFLVALVELNDLRAVLEGAQLQSSQPSK